MSKSGEFYPQRLLDETKLHVAVDIGLAFSAMMRLFERKAKNTFHAEIYSELPRLFNAKTPDEFKKIHSELCTRGRRKISLAKKKKKASYGQIAKTLDVVLKVVVYYSHFPNCTEAQRLSELLNVAMDTKMMAHVRREYLKDDEVQSWPRKIDDVRDKDAYNHVQETVRRYRKDRHLDKLLPSQFEDILWAEVNNKFGFRQN